MLYIEGYNLLNEKIKKLQETRKSFEEKVKSLSDKMGEIDNRIDYFKKFSSSEIINSLIKEWRAERQPLSEEFTGLSLEIMKIDLELKVFISAQRQLMWGGSEAFYPDNPG